MSGLSITKITVNLSSILIFEKNHETVLLEREGFFFKENMGREWVWELSFHANLAPDLSVDFLCVARDCQE